MSFHIRVNDFPTWMCTKSVLLIAKQTPNCALNNQKMCFIIPYLRHSSDLVGKENCFKIAPSYKLCLTAFRVFSSSDNPSLFPLYTLSFFNCPGKCTNAISGLLTTYQVSDSWDIRDAAKKKEVIFWEFFPNVGPPTPPFGKPCFQKKKSTA